MDPGMIVYDELLGWRLKPYWSGEHRHHDYRTQYQINRDGFRGEVASPNADNIAIYGDSFSFGLGVADGETFTAVLNAKSNDVTLNYSVPGYSTDQELLSFKQTPLSTITDAIFVIYLGNDIFDNMRAYPLQAAYGKPYFELRQAEPEAGRLVLKNTPVPRTSKPAAAQKDSIAKIVLGDSVGSSGFAGWLSRLELSKRLGIFQQAGVTKIDFDGRFSEQLVLFTTLIEAASAHAAANGVDFHVALLPGRSYVTMPLSLSAQYQEYFRQQIVASISEGNASKRHDINILDLSQPLRRAASASSVDLYFPHEGHLTAAGHNHVADELNRYLVRR